MVRMLGRKILRVPLYAQRKAVRAFHRLHKAVRRVCRRRKARRNVPHRLVGVMAQNTPAASAEQHVWSTGNQKI